MKEAICGLLFFFAIAIVLMMVFGTFWLSEGGHKKINWFGKYRFLIYQNTFIGSHIYYYSIDGKWNRDLSKAYLFKTYRQAKDVCDVLEGYCYVKRVSLYGLQEISMQHVKEDIDNVH
jgi:hypothetical protein